MDEYVDELMALFGWRKCEGYDPFWEDKRRGVGEVLRRFRGYSFSSWSPANGPDWPAPYGDLADAASGGEIRAATKEELEASRAAEDGVIEVEGRKCFVWEPGS